MYEKNRTTKTRVKRKEKSISKNIILPDHIPKEFNDRSTLWNKVEMTEKNSNA